mmetsp:Transcript_14699/g.47944  ORF Transcript_14699/g.47944 Transcript_14699/m.47944 type:complete len:290 (+) Transcript_14699:2225-3094(+)
MQVEAAVRRGLLPVERPELRGSEPRRRRRPADRPRPRILFFFFGDADDDERERLNGAPRFARPGPRGGGAVPERRVEAGPGEQLLRQVRRQVPRPQLGPREQEAVALFDALQGAGDADHRLRGPPRLRRRLRPLGPRDGDRRPGGAPRPPPPLPRHFPEPGPRFLAFHRRLPGQGPPRRRPPRPPPPPKGSQPHAHQQGGPTPSPRRRRAPRHPPPPPRLQRAPAAPRWAAAAPLTRQFRPDGLRLLKALRPHRRLGFRPWPAIHLLLRDKTPDLTGQALTPPASRRRA